MPSGAPSTFEYAPGAPVRRRKRIRRVVILLALLGVGLAGWRWGPAARDRAVMLTWQRRCMSFDFPPDVVLYQPDPARAAALLRQQDPQYIPLPFYSHNQGMITQAVYQPRCLHEFEARTSAGPAIGNRSIAFLHERRTPAGKRRLVVVYTSPWSDFGPLWEWALYDPAPLAGITSRPRLLNSGADPALNDRLYGMWISQRLGPGQADPADPTHFTLPCLANGQPTATYDGRLTDDDRVVITKQPGHVP